MRTGGMRTRGILSGSTFRALKAAVCIISLGGFSLWEGSCFAQCTKDTDCKGDRICVNGECVSPDHTTTQPALAGQQSSVVAESTPQKSSRLGPVTLYGHPLGFVQFGPVVGLEFTIIQGLTIDAHVRLAKYGVLYNLISEVFEDVKEKELKPSTMGIGTNVRYYAALPRTTGRPWGGFLFEFNTENSVLHEGDPNELIARSRSLIFGGSGGYRFRPGKSFNMTLGLVGGCAFEVLDEYEYVNGPDTVFKGDRSVYPFAMVELGIGWEFGRR